MSRINRRDFIAAIGAAVPAAVWTRAACAQQRRPVIGYLSNRPQSEDPAYLAVRDGLKMTGFVEGNLTLEFRSADDDNSRLPALAADLVRRKVAVIVTVAGIPGARAAKAATSTIPIVFFTGADPVAAGLVASLSRPGGNLTGVTTLSDEVGPKRLELMHALLPAATEFALLVDPTNPNSESQSADMRAAAQVLGLKVQMLFATGERDLDAAFAAAAQQRVAGVIIGPSLIVTGPDRNRQLVDLSARHAMPTISFARVFAEAGGLMSYGTSDPVDSYRTVGLYAGRILKGAKPGDLPVQQATRIELAINMKAAKALGLAFPLTLLGRAEVVIE